MPKDVLYYSAFNMLSQSRPSGGMGGACAIPISELLAFCQLVGIANLQERAKYLDLIQSLDHIYLTHCTEEQKRNIK